MALRRPDPTGGKGNMIAVITRVFVFSNYIECGLWCAIGVGFAFAWFRYRLPDAAIAVVTFLLFGLSDYIEAHTGAWWKPWPLLMLKGGCIVVFLVLLVRYWRAKRSGK